MKADPLRLRPSSTGASNPVQALHLYGATGIALCGWSLSQLLGFPWESYLPLWFAGALLIYNIDRLKRDPTDSTNTPRRVAAMERLRPISVGIVLGASLILILLPLLRQDWLLLALTAAGGLVGTQYSLPTLGVRLKDVPFLKSFLPPAIVVVSFVLPAILRGEISASLPFTALALLWLWLYLFFNTLLCDLRDLEGDRSAGTPTLPAFLGRPRSLRALHGILWLTLAIGLAALPVLPPSNRTLWAVLAIAGAIHQATLLFVVRSRTPSEAFFEWWVEGMLFTPPLAILLCSQMA